MSHTNLDKLYTQEIKAVKSMKERGVIEDYRFNDKAGIVWIKAEGEWIQVFSIDEVLDHKPAYQGA